MRTKRAVTTQRGRIVVGSCPRCRWMNSRRVYNARSSDRAQSGPASTYDVTYTYYTRGFAFRSRKLGKHFCFNCYFSSSQIKAYVRIYVRSCMTKRWSLRYGCSTDCRRRPRQQNGVPSIAVEYSRDDELSSIMFMVGPQHNDLH